VYAALSHQLAPCLWTRSEVLKPLLRAVSKLPEAMLPSVTAIENSSRFAGESAPGAVRWLKTIHILHTYYLL